TARSLDPVYEVEPVVAARHRAREPVDRLDETTAIPRVELRRPAERLHRGLIGGHALHEQNGLPFVAGHPERRLAVSDTAAAREKCGCGGDGKAETTHGKRFERTAPGALAQTRPC